MFLLAALVNTTISELNVTFDPDVYPASQLNDLTITVNVTLDTPIDGIEYLYNNSVIWWYNLELNETNFPQLVVDADNPANGSTWHSFTITVNRCAADVNKTIMITATLLDAGLNDFKKNATVPVQGRRYVIYCLTYHN